MSAVSFVMPPAPSHIEPSPTPQVTGRVFRADVVAALSLLIACGLLLVATADANNRLHPDMARALFWFGLLVIALPTAARLAGAAATRAERITLTAFVALAYYAVKVFHSPIRFTFHDELSTLRSAADLARSGQLFEPNPIIQIHPFYPGLELATDALRSLSGLSLFHSGIVTIGLGRLVFALALYLFLERVSGSSRAAGLGALIYTANPNFVFFDAQWAYESFALPLAMLAVCLAAHAGNSRSRGAGVLVLIAAVAVTHPVTSGLLALFFLMWAWLSRGERENRLPVRLFAATAVVAPVAWATSAQTGVESYLGPVFRNAATAVWRLATGSSTSKKLFTAPHGYMQPAWQKYVGLLAVALLLAGLGLGLAWAWRHRRSLSPLMKVLIGAALLYPLSLGFRLTRDGTEVSNRASEFVFLGLGALIGAAIVSRASRSTEARHHPRGRVVRTLARPGVFAMYLALVVVGGLIVGFDPLLPGRYVVIADSASIEAEGVAAASWSRTWLGPHNRLLSDRENALLGGSLGAQEPQTGEIGGSSVTVVFTSLSFGARERRVVHDDGISYLIADRRLTRHLPAIGAYFELDEPGAYEHRRPIARGAMEKFTAISDIDQVFDSGNLAIYDTRRVEHQPPSPRRTR
jgi:hypothetical protein